MKPFETKNELNNLLYYLNNDKKYSKRKDLVQNEINRVTKIIEVFDVLLSNKFSTDIFDTIILMALCLKIKFASKGENNDYDIELYLKQFAQEIKEGSNLKAMEISSLMSQPYEEKILADYDKHQDLERVAKLNKRAPTTDDNLKSLSDFTNILKGEICLNIAMKKERN